MIPARAIIPIIEVAVNWAPPAGRGPASPPDEGERNGGHDDERHQIGAKLGHHQQVDEDHPTPAGSPMSRKVS